MPMFSELAREARLDALDFLRTLITDPASLADNYDNDDENNDNPDPDDTPTLDLDTLHHRRLAATALLRFHVKAADDFEYDDGDDDEGNDEHDPDADDVEHDPDTNPEDIADGEHPDDTEGPNPDAEQAEYDDDDASDIADEDDAEYDDMHDEGDTNDDHEAEDDAPDSPPSASPGPGGANERSHGCSSRQRAQPVDALIIESHRPEGADEVVEPLTSTRMRATPAAHGSAPLPEN